MKLAPIGFRQAGGTIVDAFYRYDEATGSDIVTAALTINTAQVDLMGLEHIPPTKQVLPAEAEETFEFALATTLADDVDARAVGRTTDSGEPSLDSMDTESIYHFVLPSEKVYTSPGSLFSCSY